MSDKLTRKSMIKFRLTLLGLVRHVAASSGLLLCASIDCVFKIRGRSSTLNLVDVFYSLKTRVSACCIALDLLKEIKFFPVRAGVYLDQPRLALLKTLSFFLVPH